MTTTTKEIEKALIDLYLNIKLRSKEDVEEYSEKEFTEERKKLKSLGAVQIISYIRESVEILTNLKYEQFELIRKSKNKMDLSTFSTSKEDPSEYEESLQKLEAEIRSHIRIEQELKIYSDNLIQKNEDQEKLYKQAIEKSNKDTDELTKEKEKSKILQKQIEELKAKVTSLEKQAKPVQAKVTYLDMTKDKEKLKHTLLLDEPKGSTDLCTNRVTSKEISPSRALTQIQQYYKKISKIGSNKSSEPGKKCQSISHMKDYKKTDASDMTCLDSSKIQNETQIFKKAIRAEIYSNSRQKLMPRPCSTFREKHPEKKPGQFCKVPSVQKEDFLSKLATYRECFL